MLIKYKYMLIVLSGIISFYHDTYSNSFSLHIIWFCLSVILLCFIIQLTKINFYLFISLFWNCFFIINIYIILYNLEIICDLHYLYYLIN